MPAETESPPAPEPAPSGQCRPEPLEFEEVLEGIEQVLQEPRRAFEALLSRVQGHNYESLEANQRIASLLQETADRLRVAFVCTKCGEPARFRCSQAATAKTGMFTFSHGRQTHTGTTAIPALRLTKPTKDGRKS